MTLTTAPDAIDALLGVEEGSSLDALRKRRPETRLNAQASFDALFRPEYPGEVTPLERWAIASFVAGLHDSNPAETGASAVPLRAFAADELRALAGDTGIDHAIEAEIVAAHTNGPYGEYPDGPLAGESVVGPRHRVAEQRREVLGSRLSAALEHTQLLVLRPREASPEALQELLEAGWSTTDIVTISQLVAFLTFQIRVVAGLELLA